jgi:hypothetical protein
LNFQHLPKLSFYFVHREDLSRFVSEKSSLSVLKIGGCSNLDFINLCSSSLSVLWLSDLCSLSKSVILCLHSDSKFSSFSACSLPDSPTYFLQVMNCPNMSELSLCFAQQSNDCTDMVSLMDSMGRTCPNLNKMHISSNQLSNEAVFALESANLRYLSVLLFLSNSLRLPDVLVVTCEGHQYSSFALFQLSNFLIFLLLQGIVYAVLDSRFKNN